MVTVSSAEVVEIKDYAADLKEYILKPAKYRYYDAGTFLQLSLEKATASENWPESRTFSLASFGSKDKTIKLIIRCMGSYTKRIFEELRIGCECTIKYSFGDMLLPQFDNDNSIVCIAGGSGIAPFLGFVEALDQEGDVGRLKMLYTVRRESDFISYDFLANKINPENLKLFCTDDKSDKGMFRLMNIDDVTAIVDEPLLAHYYICGAPDFINFFRDALKAKGMTNIYFDEWE